MSKAVLISIRPEWCDLIVRGKKTVEVRKTRPKLETPFKVYIYCTKAPQHLITIFRDGEETMGGEIHHGKPEFIKCDKYLPDSVRDKTRMVIGEFICDRISTITSPGPFSIRNEVSGCCLTYDEVKKYAGWDNPAVPQTELHNLYGWHISDLKIYDKPLPLSNFIPNCRHLEVEAGCRAYREHGWSCPDQRYDLNPDGNVNMAICQRSVKRPPQSWCYVEEKDIVDLLYSNKEENNV